MTHRPEERIDPQVADEEDLENTEMREQLERDPESQRNREAAPDIDEEKR